jgi:hypothetical protein
MHASPRAALLRFLDWLLANGGAPVVLALAPLSVILADAGAPQSLYLLLILLCCKMKVALQSLQTLLPRFSDADRCSSCPPCCSCRHLQHGSRVIFPTSSLFLTRAKSPACILQPFSGRRHLQATRRMSAHKKRTGLFTFLPRRPLLTLRPNRGFEIPNYNEPALALWLSMEQLEGQGLHEHGRVNSIMDAARPWRRGWHPPLVPLAAGRPVHARQDFAHSREDECPTFHRHMAGEYNDTFISI